MATPFANVADYQVSLFTGAFATSYPIAVPPSPAGPSPSVSLSYSSAAVDGMRADKNNQPGPLGTGWSLGAGGSITRHFNTSCTNGNTAILDACPLDDEYSLTLNGVGSRLVYKSTSGGVKEFRLESDPMWRIQMRTDGDVARESHGEYWVVTTPDGTQYEFGNTGNSLDHVPVYTFGQPGPSCQGLEDAAWSASHVCYKAWRWNLNKVTDTFGNEMVFDYRQELDFYGVRTDPFDKGEVVRASHVARIRYGEVDDVYRAQVLFDYEVRCSDPFSAANCDEDNELVDTPVDLACRFGDASCDNAHPSYFSELNLDGIRTQVYEDGVWNTVGWWDLDRSFPQNNGPTSTEIESPAKLWLNSVTQRPGGEFSRSAFVQIEAEDFDAKSSVSKAKTSDWGAGQHMQGTNDGDWIRFDRVDFGDKAYKVLVRHATYNQSGTIEVFLDDLDGDSVATIPIASTGHWNVYETVAVNGLDISGVHDVYFRFNNPGSASKLARGDAPACSVCGRFLGMRRWLSPRYAQVVVHGEVAGDFAFASSSEFLVSDTVVSALNEAALTGLEKLEEVAISSTLRVASAHPRRYFFGEITRQAAAIDPSRSDVERTGASDCDVCFGDGISAIRGFEIDDGTWSGADMFVPRGLPGVVVVSEAFRRVAEDQDFSNIELVPTERFTWLEHCPGPEAR